MAMEINKIPSVFVDLINETIDREGRYFTDDPDDKPTNRGIVQDDLDEIRWSRHVNLKDLTDDQAMWIYWALYIKRPKLDKLHAVAPSIAKKLFDAGVVGGRKTLAKKLQRKLNSFNYKHRYGFDLVKDGILGSKTRTALSNFLAHRGEEGEKLLLWCIAAAEDDRYTDITEASRYQKKTTENQHRRRKYSYGWSLQRAAKPYI